VENGIVSEKNDKPVLDEQTLGKLLEAAYVLQEHNRELRELELGIELKQVQGEAEHRAADPVSEAQPADARPADSAPPSDYTSILAQIVETQGQIQIRQLDLDSAMSLVAERVTEIANAGGAAIAITDGKNANYRAVAGLKALPKGTAVPLDKALCVPCLRTGQVFRCEDVNPEFLLDIDECKRRGIQSLIAVPVFHEGRVAGGLELYYATHHAFTEQDVHTCQLMAGLISEALARTEEQSWKKSLATERAAVLQALEKLQPNISALIEQPAVRETAAPTSAAPPAIYTCRKCGHHLVGGEQFCGQCGTSRSPDYEPPSMQSKLASLLQMHEAQKHEAKKHEPEKKDASSPALKAEPAAENIQDKSPLSAHPPVHPALPLSFEERFPELLDEPNAVEEEMTNQPLVLAGADTSRGNSELEGSSNTFERTARALEPQEAQEDESTEEATALAKPSQPAHWASAASARQFLEELASVNRPRSLLRFWNARKGDVYLAIALILVAAVIRWGMWSDHPVPTTAAPAPGSAAQRKPAPDANLSAFDRMLIRLGLAEPPDTHEDKGNPAVQVWVDQRTALYYCPGSDLYGKTPKGKYTSQRDAQLDQFEPAYRKSCN